MSKKLTITIPDELHERLERVRHLFNISAVCQHAIEQNVIILEQHGESNMESLVNRLQAEKNLFDEDSKMMGKKEGAEDALTMISLSDFKTISKAFSGRTTIPESLAFETLYQTDLYKGWLSMRIDTLLKDHNIPKYLEGWFEGVFGVYMKAKSKLN